MLLALVGAVGCLSIAERVILCAVMVSRGLGIQTNERAVATQCLRDWVSE